MYPDAFDSVSSFTKERQEITLSEYVKSENVGFISDSASHIIETLGLNENVDNSQRRFQLEFISSAADLKKRKPEVSRAGPKSPIGYNAITQI